MLFRFHWICLFVLILPLYAQVQAPQDPALSAPMPLAVQEPSLAIAPQATPPVSNEIQPTPASVPTPSEAIATPTPPATVAAPVLTSAPAIIAPIDAQQRRQDFLKQTGNAWYHLLESIGIITFALAGLIGAYLWGTSLFGALLLSFLLPFGGGIIRDLLFDRSPIGFLQSQSNVSIVFAITVIGFFVLGMGRDRSARDVKSRDASLTQASALFEGISLSILTVTGTMVALAINVQPLWLWGPFAAMLTTTGGEILRDLMLKNHGATVVNSGIYPELSLLWGWLLSCYISCWHYQYAEAGVILIGTMLGTFATWAMVRALKIKNLTFGG